MAALRGGAVLPGTGLCGASTGTAARGTAGGGASRQPPLRAGSPLQCFSFEEDDLNLSLDAETIPEAEEILGTMQNYLDSSVISIIEDLSISEGKACLDAQNELSLLTAITEILDSTDDETLSPFDTIMDAELLTSLRERENSSFQKFLSLSRPVLEGKSPALEQPKGLWSLSSGGSTPEAGKTDVDLAWDCIAHSLEDPSPPKKQTCSTPRVERKQGRPRAHEQLPLQRSDGEEEDEEAASSPELDSSMEAAEFCVNAPEVVMEEHEDPCVINTSDVSLSELVKSMHPYCLPTFTVCLDPETEPVAKELLSGPVVLEIVPREGENMEIPVVLQPLAPSFPDLEPQLLGTESNTESIPVHGEELPGDPAPEAGMEEEEKPSGQDPSCAALDSKTPMETAVSSKREICEKGRGRERARKSRKKKAGVGLSEDGRPGRDGMAHQLRSGRSRRAARPSLQVSDFLARQLEQARKEGQMELHAERVPRPRGRPRGTARASLPTKEPLEVPKELEPDMTGTVLEKGETAVPEEKTTEEPLAAKPPSPAEQEDKGAAQPDVEMPKQDVGMEPPQSVPAAEPSETLPKEAKPKALSLREYRMRMQHRQSSMGSKEGKKQAASKWPSVPEPPTELADIPCLVAPAQLPTETPSAQKSLEKSSSSPAGPPPTSKAPAAPAPAATPALAPAPAPAASPAPAPALAPALAPASAPPPPVPQIPFVPPAVPPAAGAAPPGMPPLATTGGYAMYPPVPSWPCFGPQPLGCHALPPPPGAGPPGTFHMMPGLPPPPMAWPQPTLPPPPALPPPPPFIPSGPYGPVGWAPPSYWPGIPIPPPPVPPMAYSDPALQGAAASSIPASGHPSTALLHGQAPPAPELPAIPVQPSPGTETGTAGSQTRPGVSRVSNPRRQARLVGESSFPKGPSAPAPTQPPVTPLGAAAQPSRVPPAAPAPNVAAPTQPLEELPPPAPIQPSKAPQAVTPAEVSAAAVPAGGSPGTNPTEEPVGPAKTPEDKTPVEPSSHKSITQAPAPPPKPCRESSKPPAARPWRHQPLISPVQNSNSSQDIVQAFISEIGIEAADLSSLLEQFEKSEAKKEEIPVQPPEEKLPVRSAGSEPQPEKKPPDSLQASELANVAGLTPPATPPHQLWKPLPTVSLLAKTKSPVSAPQEGSQRTAKLTKAKALPQSKLQGRSPVPGSAAPSHVCSGDHDYCNPRVTRLENSSMAGTQPPATESGSRWNVKHHRDITIKPISSLTKRTLDQPKPTPAAAAGPSQESPGAACSTPLDYRTNVPSKAVTECDSPATSVLLSPAASPCRDQEVWTPSTQPGRVTAKKSLRCYRRPQDSPSPSAGSWRAGRSRASRSFSSSSDGASESSSSSSSSRSRSRSLSPPSKRWRGYRSRCSHSSSSRSSCGSCGRSRDRSSSSSSSSSYSSQSPSRRQSRSRSPSPCRRSNRRRRYSYDAQDHYQRQRILQKERAIEERRVVFIGKIPSRMTRSELRHRFSVFGDIEECTLHFRSEGDNYGFVTYRYAEEAFAAIESGHKLRRPDEQPFDLCFGGRRQFCRRNYADLDSNREDFDPAPVKSKFDSLDFDTLLRQAQRSLRR